MTTRIIRLGNLHGPGGNAFSIMGNVRHQGLQQGMSTTELDAIITEMMDGDYDHLLDTVLKHFQDLDGSIESFRNR